MIKTKTVTKKPKESVEPKLEKEIVFRFNTLAERPRGNEYEEKVRKVCSKNRYPFAFKDGGVNHVVPDFISREKKKIIEVYNPARSDEEVYARMKTFHVKGFKVRQFVKHDLIRPDWKLFLTRIIGGFLSE